MTTRKACLAFYNKLVEGQKLLISRLTKVEKVDWSKVEKVNKKIDPRPKTNN